jgi:hypothetical protein
MESCDATLTDRYVELAAAGGSVGWGVDIDSTRS